MQVSLDEYDRKILAALVQNGALTNAQLSEIVNLDFFKVIFITCFLCFKKKKKTL